MFNEKAFEYLKEDAMGRTVPLMEVISSVVDSALTMEGHEALQFYNIAPLCEDWTLEDIVRIRTVMDESCTGDPFEQFSEMLNLVIELGHTYGPDHKFTFAEFAELIRQQEYHDKLVLQDLIDCFAGSAGISALDFLQVFDEIEVKTEEDYRIADKEADELEKAQEVLIQHVRSELMKIVFPKE